MRRLASAALPEPNAIEGRRSDAQTLRKLLPYVWSYRWRVALALARRGKDL